MQARRWAWVRPKIWAGGGAADNSGGARRARDARGYARRVRLDGREKHAGGGRRQGGARSAVEDGKAGHDRGRRWRARRGRRRKAAEAALRGAVANHGQQRGAGGGAALQHAEARRGKGRGVGRGGGLGSRAGAVAGAARRGPGMASGAARRRWRGGDGGAARAVAGERRHCGGRGSRRGAAGSALRGGDGAAGAVAGSAWGGGAATVARRRWCSGGRWRGEGGGTGAGEGAAVARASGGVGGSARLGREGEEERKDASPLDIFEIDVKIYSAEDMPGDSAPEPD
ncbi:uncharacterized protein [Miscanthus floridulus]|uniref:uncharacterized protein n=1 Tax=Miscanthus floridulus TaxID=154761 RepID=UPI003457C376